MLGKRIITALLGVPVAVYVIHTGAELFFGAMVLLVVLAWREYRNMLAARQFHVFHFIGLMAAVLMLACAWQGNAQESIMVLFLLSMTAFLASIFLNKTHSLPDAAFTVLGVVYVGIGFSHLVSLRFLQAEQWIHTPWARLQVGEAYLWLAFLGTWASDTFAYFVGSLLGKHKLCPSVSPGKTIEGALGGLSGSILFVALLGMLFQVPLIHGIVLGLLVGLAAPLGDLAESGLKRFCGVKDSGQLLPGHGGILDRFDSILFAVPAVYYYTQIILFT